MSKQKIPPQLDQWWNKIDIQKPRRERQMDWLKKCLPKNVGSPKIIVEGIILHREGGYGFNKDLRELVNLKLLEMVRIPYSKGWGGDYDLKYTKLIITDLGKEVIDRGFI